MSMKADIEQCFDEAIQKINKPLNEADLLALKFAVYESLQWDDSAGKVVAEMQEKGHKVDGNMKCYLNDYQIDELIPGTKAALDDILRKRCDQ